MELKGDLWRYVLVSLERGTVLRDFTLDDSITAVSADGTRYVLTSERAVEVHDLASSQLLETHTTKKRAGGALMVPSTGQIIVWGRGLEDTPTLGSAAPMVRLPTEDADEVILDPTGKLVIAWARLASVIR